MRINKFFAQATGMSRRAADGVIAAGRLTINGKTAQAGQDVSGDDIIKLDNRTLSIDHKPVTIALNKPVGYVVSREGQGSKTIYDLLPTELHHLKPVGRLDKDSSGLLLLTNDGELAHKLTHPTFQKEKVYEVELDKPLTPGDKARIEKGVMLEGGISSLQLTVDSKQRGKTVNRQLSAVNHLVRMHEGRNRQIRRTFAALGYTVTRLHRTQFGPFTVNDLALGKYINL